VLLALILSWMTPDCVNECNRRHVRTDVSVGCVHSVVHDFVCVIVPGCCLKIRVYVGRLLRKSNFEAPANVSFIYVQ
jgi:hypothetical protein